uniref:Malic enzyme N-terminal domain-containing protein n=1 Tax=Lactuca sativa TaxID=4236 RepID=A0A9R1UDA8_LACSA|nr:hypothetical protein LSAT_V11C900469830 [Lactuca sativa]
MVSSQLTALIENKPFKSSKNYFQFPKNPPNETSDTLELDFSDTFGPLPLPAGNSEIPSDDPVVIYSRSHSLVGPTPCVDMVVLTDGNRILGLGDLGVQGMAIPIGKLDMYVAAAGINPQRILPIMLDVGTNNQQLLHNPLYIGLRQPRLEGDEYISVVDELMEALHARWPKAIVQGTAGVALAGLLGTVRAQGRPLSDFANQKIVVVGAGSAGLGVLKVAYQAAARMAGSEAKPQFFLLDKDERGCIDSAVAPFAKDIGEVESLGLHEGSDLLEVVKKVKPHVLLGLSGVGGVFNEHVDAKLKDAVEKEVGRIRGLVGLAFSTAQKDPPGTGKTQTIFGLLSAILHTN